MPRSNEPVSRSPRPGIHTDPLVPQAGRLLATVAKATWQMTKLLAHVAIRIPGWFVRANRRHVDNKNQ